MDPFVQGLSEGTYRAFAELVGEGEPAWTASRSSPKDLVSKQGMEAYRECLPSHWDVLKHVCIYVCKYSGAMHGLRIMSVLQQLGGTVGAAGNRNPFR